jgi:hypothetical protein
MKDAQFALPNEWRMVKGLEKEAQRIKRTSLFTSVLGFFTAALWAALAIMGALQAGHSSFILYWLDFWFGGPFAIYLFISTLNHALDMAESNKQLSGMVAEMYNMLDQIVDLQE